MYSFLLIAFFSQLFLVLFERAKFKKIRESFLQGIVLFFGIIALSTEGLSFFRSLNSTTVIYFWVVANLILTGFLLLSLRKYSFSITKIDLNRFDSTKNKLYLLAVVFIYATVLIIALTSPPNTFDSQTYHLARVAHWVQNQSVEFYPTAILRQIYQNPLAEYAILHLQLLTGDDRFANLIQWICYISCGVAASLIAQKAGFEKKIQILAVFFSATVPMAILQGSSTQNDLVVSVFVLAFFYFYLITGEHLCWKNTIFAGLSLGVALLSKGTAILYCFPVGVLIFGGFFSKVQIPKNKRKFVMMTFVVCLIAVSINAGHYTRNIQLFGTPVSTGDDVLSNQSMSFSIVFANIIRNYTLHLGTNTQIDSEFTEPLVRKILGAEADNPDSTTFRQHYSVKYSQEEDSAGNLLHIIFLTIIISFFVFVYWRRRENEDIALLSLSIIGGFILFCLLLQWQPWSSRLHLPLFMLSSPVIAAFISRCGKRTAILITILFFIGCLPFLLQGNPRAVFATKENESIFTVPRFEQYFANRKNLRKPYTEVIEFLKQAGAEEIGVDMTFDHNNYNYGDWEYLLWISMKKDFAQMPVFRHVGVKNISAKLDQTGLPPEWIISANQQNTIDGVQYDEVLNSSPLRVLRKHPDL